MIPIVLGAGLESGGSAAMIAASLEFDKPTGVA